MANRDTAHVSDDDLLRFLDGEADKADEVAIVEHLAACWSCRARRDDLETMITTVVHAMDEVILPDVPPPGPWEGLEPHLARVDEQLNAEVPFVRWRTAVGSAFRASRLRWAAAATVAAIVITIAFLQQSTVTAAELLTRARPVDQLTAHRQLTIEERQGTTRPLVTRRRIEIWQNITTGERARRMYDERNQLLAGEWTRADGSRVVYRRGETPNHEDGGASVTTTPDNVWRLELAASTFATIAGDPQRASVDERADAFVLSSHVGSRDAAGLDTGGQLSVLSLTLSVTTLHPIEQSFTFGSGSDARTFRIVETLFSEMPASRIPLVAFVPDAALTGVVANAATLTPKPAAVRRLSPSELLGLEVRALVRLDGAGALLGEQVNVTRTPKSVVRIEALVETPERKTELLRALDSLAPRWGVELEIQTFAEAQQRRSVRQDGSPVVRSVEMMDARAPVFDDLKRYFAEELARKATVDGGASATAPDAEARLDKDIRAFTGRVLEHSLQARLHARALTQAVARVSARELASLDPEGAQAWRALIRDHAAAFGRETESLRVALQPIFFATPPAPRASAAPSPQDVDVWESVARVFALASAHDAAVGQAFAVSAMGATPPLYLKQGEFWHSLRSAEEIAARLQAAADVARVNRP